MSTTSISLMPIRFLDDFATYLSNLDDPHGIIADDLEGEFNFPHQSFVLKGRTEFERLHDQADSEPWTVTIRGTQPLPEGIFIDADIESRVGRSRTATILTVRGDQVVGLKHWCTGDLAHSRPSAEIKTAAR